MAGNENKKPAGKLSYRDSFSASNPGDCQFSVPFAGNWNNNNRNNGLSVRPVTELTGCPSSFSFKTTPEDLLLDLYRAYKDARRHKRRKDNVQRFSYNVEEELVRLRDDIFSRKYSPSPCSCFIIHDSKIREIFAADFRDRIVHHLYYNNTKTLFERSFIYDTYSCIKGRGTHFGIERLKHHILPRGHCRARLPTWKNDIQCPPSAE